MNFVIQKQLLINNLPFPAEIQDSIKEHLFIDCVTAKTKQNKALLINTINKFYYSVDNGITAISYRYEFQFQSYFCQDCGGYELVGTLDNYINMSHSALCSCQGFMDIYLQNIGDTNTTLLMYM